MEQSTHAGTCRAPDFMVELVFTETPGMAMAAARACCMMV